MSGKACTGKLAETHLNLLIANVVSSIGRGSEIEEEYNKQFLSTVGLLPTQHEEPEDIYRHSVQQSNGNRKIIRKLTALAQGEKKKSVRDELDVEAEGEFPEHWRDEKHEEDGTERSHIEAKEGVEHSQKENQVDLGNYFKKGENVGARVLKDAMSAVLESEYEAIDDVSGTVLDEKMVREARRVELEHFERMGVYTRVTMAEAKKSGMGKFIQGRWLDINKGDKDRPDYRSRFVGKEFNTGSNPEFFAATPPLEALKLILGHAASRKAEGAHVMMSDVKRA